MNKNATALLVIIIIVFGAFYFSGYSKKTSNTENIEATIDANTAVTTRVHPDQGNYLTDLRGIALYTYSDDKSLESVCFDECEKNWPIFEYDARQINLSKDTLTKMLNTIERADGRYQYAFENRPLYYYSGDKNPGETKGIYPENSGGKWSLVIVQ